MPDKPSDQPSRRRSSRSRSPEHGPAQVRDRMEPRKRDNRGAQKGKQSLSKSAQQQVRHLLTVGQSTRGVGKSMSDLTNIKPKFDEQGKLFPLISDDEVLYRFNKKGGNEPDFMERVSADPSASDFNWMARQDRFSKPNAYIGKTTTDRQSLAALVNRIEQLAEEHNTSVASFRIELVPQFFVENIATKLKKVEPMSNARTSSINRPVRSQKLLLSAATSCAAEKATHSLSVSSQTPKPVSCMAVHCATRVTTLLTWTVLESLSRPLEQGTWTE